MTDVMQIISAVSTILGILGIACAVFLFFVRLRLTPLEEDLKKKASKKDIEVFKKEIDDFRKEKEEWEELVKSKASKRELGFKASAEGLGNLKKNYEDFVMNSGKNMETLFDTVGEISEKNANYRVELAEKYVRNDRFNLDMERVDNEMNTLHGRITGSGKKR